MSVMVYRSWTCALRMVTLSIGTAAVLTFPLCLLGTGQAVAEAWPTRVNALYGVTFNGFKIGTFRFEANVSQQGYTLDGDADLSALLGVFSWKGITHSNGRVQGNAPQPAGYSFAFQSSARSGAVRMSFDKTGVTHVSADPTTEPSPEMVPVETQHLKDVLDPLTAVMALTRGSKSNPCRHKLPIFDGKQRFNLNFAFRRQESVTEAQPSGQPVVSYVCGVRYVPVAGYTMNEETRRMSENTDIEVALRPIPSANLFIPQQITIPTIAGTARLTAERIEIMTEQNGQIALVN